VAFVLVLFLIALAALGGFLLGTRRTGTSPSRDHVTLVPLQAPFATASEDDVDDPIGREKARIIRTGESEAAQLRQKLADCEAIIANHAEVDAEREALLRNLAEARAETARYRQLVIDIENNARPLILAGIAEPDDLKMIVGVGPVLERMLHQLGITSFRQIARWTERDIAEFDARLPEFPGRIQRDQWVIQARALHQSKYGEHMPEQRGPT